MKVTALKAGGKDSVNALLINASRFGRIPTVPCLALWSRFVATCRDQRCRLMSLARFAEKKIYYVNTIDEQLSSFYLSLQRCHRGTELRTCLDVMMSPAFSYPIDFEE
mmetsp:Transcript_17720/g.38795  ORF Transcript_17720/g.38795 Transcript_17720/m.38795 type:complete len:108 (-) Transcript_17720:773-1096(-)